MQKSEDAVDEIKEIKNISGRRSIREDNFNFEKSLLGRKKVINNNEDRSISEPPQTRCPSSSSLGYINNHISDSSNSMRLKTIREKMDDNNQCSSDEDDFSKSNSQLNGSDLDLEIPESASQTPTPTPLMANARRINSETNLNDSKRRLTGFMGNRSKRFCASTSELNFSSNLDTHKSLFSPKNNQSGSRPGSLYGSNMSLNSSSNNSRLFMVNSPFYSGKTMFGGASAYPRRDINQHKILRNPIQMRPSSSLSNSSNTSTKSEGGGAAGGNGSFAPESNAAKRILEIMTQFSGPLKETRSMGSNINSMIKIPGLVQNQKRFGEEELQLNRSIALSRPIAPYSRSIGGTQSTKTQKNTPESIAFSFMSGLNTSPQIPTMSQLLKMKQLHSNTERAREIANRSENFLNSEYKLPSTTDEYAENNGQKTVAVKESNASSSLKMKNNITKNLLRNDKIIDHQLPEPLNLPNIQLPELKSYPKFDIKLPSSLADSSSAMSSNKSNSYNSIKSNVAKNAIKPVETLNSVLLPTNSNISKATNDKFFKFSMPIILNAAISDVGYSQLKVSTDKFVFSKPASINKKEDTCEISKSIVATSSAISNDSLFKSLIAKQKAQWECQSCLTHNGDDKMKCLCCDTTKPGNENSKKLKESSTNTSTTTQTFVSSDGLFKKLAAQQKKSHWECDACMTKNDLNKEKCACCETPKPGANKPTSSSFNSSTTAEFKFGMPSTPKTEETKSAVVSDDLFKNLAQQQKKSQWECDACLTRNDTDKEDCACCNTPKPGTSTKSVKSQSSIASTFSFGMPSATSVVSNTAESTVNNSFSFGMPPSSSPKTVDASFKKILEKQNANWECSVCMTRNDPSKSKCICCENSKPNSSDKQASFSFASKVSLPPPTEVKFKFGVQPLAKIEESLVSKDVNTTISEKHNEEKNDEVDKPVNQTLSSSSSLSSTSSSFKFGSLPLSMPPVTQTTSVTETSSVGFKLASTETIKSISSDSTTTSFTFKAPTSNVKTISTSFTLPAVQGDEKKELTDNSDSDKSSKSLLKDATDLKNNDKKVTFNIEDDKTAERPGGFSFASSLSTTTKTNGGINFDSFSKPEDIKKDASIASSGGFQFGTSLTNEQKTTFLFGSSAPAAIISSKGVDNASSNAVAASTTTTSTNNLFSFEAQKTQSIDPSKSAATFGSFGNNNSSQSTSTFNSFVFGGEQQKKDENTAPSPGNFSFTAKPISSNMVFGSLSSGTTAPSVTPVFGSNVVPTFGSSVGSNTALNINNNENAFGSKMSGSFGNASGTPQKRPFDFGSNISSDNTQNKKFDFGPQASSQANTTPFQFNAQQETKPAFSFTASSVASTPSFNFSANNMTSNLNPQTQQSQQQPATAPPIFGAATPTVALGGINAFVQGTGANAQNRKILRASRRTVNRR